MMWGSWIPPVPFALGALFGIVSWIIAIAYGIEPSAGRGLAWVHAVALGSITTIAMSVLIHVIPGFTDLEWRFKPLARWCALLLPFAAAGLVASFFFVSVAGIAVFGIAAASLVLAYVVPAIATLVQRAPTKGEAAIARAFVFVMLFLGIAVIIGGLVARSFLTGNTRVLQLAPAHAALALIGWLTMLTMGVSARTLRPILRSESRFRPLHIASNSGMLLCALTVAVGFGVQSSAVTTIGFALGLLGALLYAFDALDRVRRASTPNRPAHAFIASALVWLVIASIAAITRDYPLAIVVALAGWLGQMVNAHLHHLGIRVIATTVGGDEDETRPWEMIDMRVGWATVVLDQLAVLALALGVALSMSEPIVCGGVLGLAGMLTLLANVRIAIEKARTQLRARAFVVRL